MAFQKQTVWKYALLAICPFLFYLSYQLVLFVLPKTPPLNASGPKPADPISSISAYCKKSNANPITASAVKALQTAAGGGDAKAQVQLGKCYFYGQGVPQDYSKAADWFRKAAGQWNVEALAYLGSMFADGQGVPQDNAEALALLRQAAEKGNAIAQRHLGDMYAFGKGARQNFSEAVKWYRQAAEQGNVAAQAELGRAYAHGTGVQRDFSKSVKWLQKAAIRGNISAQIALGQAYESGRGVPQDNITAFMWFNLVFTNFGLSPNFKKHLDRLERVMTADQLQYARKKTVELKSKLKCK